MRQRCRSKDTFLKAMQYEHCKQCKWAILMMGILLANVALSGFGQTALTNGISQQGSLSSPTSSQSWTLQAKPGDHISRIVAKLTEGASFNPQISATSPPGSFLG